MKSVYLLALIFCFSMPSAFSQSYVKLKSGKKIVGKFKTKKDNVEVKTANGKKVYPLKDVESVRTKNGERFPITYTVKGGKKEKFGFFERHVDGFVSLYTQETIVPTRDVMSSGNSHIVFVLDREDIGAAQIGIVGVVGISKKEKEKVLLRYMGDNKQINTKIQNNLKDYTNHSYDKMVDNLSDLVEEYNQSK